MLPNFKPEAHYLRPVTSSLIPSKILAFLSTLLYDHLANPAIIGTSNNTKIQILFSERWKDRIMYINILIPVEPCCMRSADSHSMSEDWISETMALLLLYLAIPQYYTHPVNAASHSTTNTTVFIQPCTTIFKILELTVLSPVDIAKSHLL